MQEDFIPEYIVAACFVVVNAFRRYNTPDTNRATTTFENFTIFCGLYLLASLALYTLITAIFHIFPNAMSRFFALPEYAKSLSAPMIAALFLTSLLPTLPWLSKIDKWLLNWFWDHGNIPTHIMNLAAMMRRSPYRFAPNQVALIRRLCKEQEIDSALININDCGSLDYRWARVMVLLEQLEQWKNGLGFNNTGRLRRFLEKNLEEIKEFKAKEIEITKEFRELKLDRLDNRAEKRIERFLDRAMAELFHNITIFIAKTVCMAELRESGRNKRINDLGFELIEARKIHLTGEQIFKALACIVAVFLMISIAEVAINPGQDSRQVPFLTVLMLCTYGAALLLALDLNNHKSLGFNELTKRRPLIGYLALAVATFLSWVVLAIIVRFVFNMFDTPTSENWQNVLTHISWSFPYALQSVALAFVVSLTLNWHQAREVQLKLSHVNRRKDLAKAIPLMAASSIIAYCWINGAIIPDAWATRDLERISSLTASHHFAKGGWFVLKGLAVMSVVIWLVPTWFFVNRSSSPSHVAGRLIAMNRDDIAKEIQRLDPDDLIKVVSAVAAKVAGIDGNISPCEKDVYKLICSQLSRLPNSDIDMDKTDSALYDCIKRLQGNNLDLAKRLSCLSGKPLLASLMPYLAYTVAFADGVYLNEEGDVVAEVQNLKPA